MKAQRNFEWNSQWHPKESLGLVMDQTKLAEICFVASHRVSEGRASSKTTPKNCPTCRLKSSKNNIFRQLLLPSVACGCCSKTASKKSPPGGKHRASEGRASSKTTPKNCLTCRLKSSKNNIFRQLLLPSVACGCCSKTASKKSPPGGKHRASEGRASSKTTPKNCLTCRLKSSKNNLFRQLLLPSVACGCCSKTASNKSPPGGKHRASEGRASSKTTPKNCLTCRLKSSKNNIFRQLLLPSVACGCCSKTASNKSPRGGKTPCLWRTS